MVKEIFNILEEVSSVETYRKLNFTVTAIDDAAGFEIAEGSFLAQEIVTDQSWAYILSKLETCKKLNLKPLLKFGDMFMPLDRGIEFSREKIKTTI